MREGVGTSEKMGKLRQWLKIVQGFVKKKKNPNVKVWLKNNEEISLNLCSVSDPIYSPGHWVDQEHP